jgi:hypothetical protein
MKHLSNLRVRLNVKMEGVIDPFDRRSPERLFQQTQSRRPPTPLLYSTQRWTNPGSATHRSSSSLAINPLAQSSNFDTFAERQLSTSRSAAVDSRAASSAMKALQERNRELEQDNKKLASYITELETVSQKSVADWERKA